MKVCPYCGEEIQDFAKKCKYCGEGLSQNKTPSQSIFMGDGNSTNNAKKNTKNNFKKLGNDSWIKRNWIRVVIIGGIIGVGGFFSWRAEYEVNTLNNINYTDENGNRNTNVLSDIENTTVVSTEGKQMKEGMQSVALNETQYTDRINSLDIEFYDSYYTNSYQLNSLIGRYKLYKQYNTEYVNNITNIFDGYSEADLNDGGTYSVSGKLQKIRQLMNYTNTFADKMIVELEYLVNVQDHISIGNDGTLLFDNQNILDTYNNLSSQAQDAGVILTNFASEYDTYIKAWSANNK